MAIIAPDGPNAMDTQSLTDFLEFSNEILSAAIAIIATSILLYNITRNTYDRVNRASSLLLGCITIAYVADVFISASPGPIALENWFRIQWVGVAFIPATLFHLSDALLATTGLVSRGRRRRAVRRLYIVGACFALAALFSDSIIGQLTAEPVWHMRPGNLFPVYLLYFAVAVSFAFYNVIRARLRCLTTFTRRRMSYLMAVFLMPAWGLFPYSLLFSLLFSEIASVSLVVLWIVFNVANVAVLAMLLFMAYPLSFFGNYKPDRVVKAELLQFMLRGPLMGVIVVVLIQTLPRVSTVLGIEGEQFTSFAAVAIVLFFQWMITLVMPYLESWLVYSREQQQARYLHEISERLVTRADAVQLQEAILAAVCDQLRVSTAFIVPIGFGETNIEQVGEGIPPAETEKTHMLLANGFTNPEQLEVTHTLGDEQVTREGDFFRWRSFWLLPLYQEDHKNGKENGSKTNGSVYQVTGNGHEKRLVGILGISARTEKPNLKPEEERILHALVARATELLVNLRVQDRVFSNLAGLVTEPEIRPKPLQERVNITPYGQVQLKSEATEYDSATTSPRDVELNDSFVDLVRDALRDYWGGPKLIESKLLDLNVVDAESKQEENRVQALRKVLMRAIESLRPEGQQNMTRSDWIMYNILEMRFLQGRKVRDVAPRLAMSPADFYRKQSLAIKEVARIIIENERQSRQKIHPAANGHAEGDTMLFPADA